MTQSVISPCGARHRGTPHQAAAKRAWLLGLSLALVPASAFAQGAAADPAPEGAALAASEDQPARAKVLVVVRLGTSGLDTARLLTALRQELPVELTTRSDLPSDGMLVLDLEASEGFVVGVYTASDGRKTARSVTRPTDPAAALDVIVLLAGNLVRNEAKELLKELERSRAKAARQAAKPPPPPPPAAAASSPGKKNRGENKGGLGRADVGGSSAPVADEPMPKLRDGGVLHLSLFHPIALDSHSQDLSTDVEIGLFYSRTGESRALGLNPFVLRADARAQGLQLAGIFTYAKRLEGVQLSGVGNVAAGADGLQLSGVGNLSRGVVNGVQISGLINIADAVRGLQIAAVNVADDVDGIQLGVVNIADEVDGASIGLVSLAKNGRVQPTLWVAEGKRTNAGVAFEVGPIYSLAFLGVDLPSDQRRYEWGFALGLKGRVDRVWGAIDFGYSSEQERIDGAIKPLERGRVLAGVELLERSVTLFGGVGVRSSELREATPESHFGVAFF